jgi:hypothetical protein
LASEDRAAKRKAFDETMEAKAAMEAAAKAAALEAEAAKEEAETAQFRKTLQFKATKVSRAGAVLMPVEPKALTVPESPRLATARREDAPATTL